MWKNGRKISFNSTKAWKTSTKLLFPHIFQHCAIVFIVQARRFLISSWKNTTWAMESFNFFAVFSQVFPRVHAQRELKIAGWRKRDEAKDQPAPFTGCFLIENCKQSFDFVKFSHIELFRARQKSSPEAAIELKTLDDDEDEVHMLCYCCWL